VSYGALEAHEQVQRTCESSEHREFNGAACHKLEQIKQIRIHFFE
jgi:hypothetical protein